MEDFRRTESLPFLVTGSLLKIKLTFLSNFVNETFRIFPSEARIGDGAARSHVVTDVLSAFKQIAFDHNTFDQFVEIRIVVAAVKHFTYNTNLFFVLFAGVRMVDIHDNGRILQIFFAV